jgi:RNase P subunit RPR2
MIEFLKRLFCKHQYIAMKKVSIFCSLNGETVIIACERCGKIKEEIFYTNEEFASKYKSGDMS